MRPIRLRGQSNIAGLAGFREFFDPSGLQLIYGLLPKSCTQGLATEAAPAVCDHAFFNPGFSEIRAAIDVPNRSSARVPVRLGMRKARDADNEGPAGAAHYVLDRAGWVERRRRDGQLEHFELDRRPAKPAEPS